MELNNKFEIGEVVYTISHNNMELKCNVCENGFILYKEKAYKCPECNGNAKILSSHKIWEVVEEEVKIRRVKASIGNGYINIKYALYSDNFRVKNRGECNLFKTKEEAQKECDRLNKPEETETIKYDFY